MPAYTSASIDFGYPWWLSYGHLPVLAAAVSILLLGYARKWSRWRMLFLGVVALWSGAALLVERFVIDINGRAALPTQAFLRSGVGRVLDIGAGTGRSSIMVLQSPSRSVGRKCSELSTGTRFCSLKRRFAHDRGVNPGCRYSDVDT